MKPLSESEREVWNRAVEEVGSKVELRLMALRDSFPLDSDRWHGAQRAVMEARLGFNRALKRADEAAQNAPNHSPAGLAESQAPAPSEPGDGGVAPTGCAASGAPDKSAQNAAGQTPSQAETPSDTQGTSAPAAPVEDQMTKSSKMNERDIKWAIGIITLAVKSDPLGHVAARIILGAYTEALVKIDALNGAQTNARVFAAYYAANDYIRAMLNPSVSKESLVKIAENYWQKVREVK